MLEEPARISLALGEPRLRRLALGDILDGEQNASPVLLVAGKNAALQLHVEAAAG